LAGERVAADVDRIVEPLAAIESLKLYLVFIRNYTMSLTEDFVRARLSEFIDVHTETDLVKGGAVKGIGVAGSKVSVELRLSYPAKRFAELLAEQVREHLLDSSEITAAVVDVSWTVHAHKVQKELTPLSGVKNIIAIASGKGGVGKSTTAANLALALASEGARVGVLDADIYGPSQVLMLGITTRAESKDGGYTLAPKVNYGLEMMSIGLMASDDTPMVLRGPMVTKALMEMLLQTQWGTSFAAPGDTASGLDYLVIDLPPGTGDIQLTLCQRVPVSGALIVTTPQDLALLDAKKALKMFEKVDVPVLGIVENMATHVCTQCGFEEAIFGAGGGAKMAGDYQIPLLGQLPLAMQIRCDADSGTPTVVHDPDCELSERYRMIARKTAAKLGLSARNKAIAFPKIVIQNT
jgi:ATP-binding protein involved in chromosome partitioning